MKKTFLMAAAVLFTFCGGVFADELKINGEFKVLTKKGDMPAGWSKNGPGVKNTTYKIIRKGDDNILKLVSTGGYSALYSSVRVPVKGGETFKVELKAKGKAKCFSVGYYAYDSKNRFSGSNGVSFNVDNPQLFKEYKGSFVVKKPAAGKSIDYIQIAISGHGAMDIEIEEVEVEKVLAGK